MKLTTKTKVQPSGLHFTVNHSGKMAGLQSLSGSPMHNELCQKRNALTSAICKYCFSIRQAIHYGGKENTKDNSYINPFKKNDEILQNTIIPADQIPQIKGAKYFRFAAFNEYTTTNEIINAFNIAKANPDIKCAIWTKTPHIIAQAIAAGHKKPKNLRIVYSSILVNHPANYERMAARFPFIDLIFTVYDNKNQVKINCGARSCATCGRCYEKRINTRYVNEFIK